MYIVSRRNWVYLTNSQCELVTLDRLVLALCQRVSHHPSSTCIKAFEFNLIFCYCVYNLLFSCCLFRRVKSMLANWSG